MDYERPEGEKAAIAMIRIPSKYPVDSVEYRGPVLINPGGPGGSGVGWILSTGEKLARVVGPEFDILGFDPRGEFTIVASSLVH